MRIWRWQHFIIGAIATTILRLKSSTGFSNSNQTTPLRERSMGLFAAAAVNGRKRSRQLNARRSLTRAIPGCRPTLALPAIHSAAGSTLSMRLLAPRPLTHITRWLPTSSRVLTSTALAIYAALNKPTKACRQKDGHHLTQRRVGAVLHR